MEYYIPCATLGIGLSRSSLLLPHQVRPFLWPLYMRACLPKYSLLPAICPYTCFARPPTHLLACLQGTTLLKYGRHGAPKIHYFRLSTDDTELQWESKVRPSFHT